MDQRHAWHACYYHEIAYINKSLPVHAFSRFNLFVAAEAFHRLKS
jgi:hypothetical protein